jgi:hypothetical protein
VARLIRWAWPDGVWNCDVNPDADTSSFMESLIPLRALAQHARVAGSEDSRAAAERAAEVFLSRQLFRRRSDGSVINKDFVVLHYPCYWHYDILFGLKVMAEAVFLDDPRCAPALALLESMRLPDGGFPAGAKYWTVSDRPTSGRSRVPWGPVSATRMNPWVTADALAVLRAHRAGGGAPPRAGPPAYLPARVACRRSRRVLSFPQPDRAPLHGSCRNDARR